MKKFLRAYAFLFSIAGLLIIFDQYTKHIVRQNLDFQEAWAPWHWLLRYMRIINWRNTGAAFGMFQSWGDVFMVLAMIVSVVIVIYFPKVDREDWLIRVGMSMQLAGAVGNLIDRLHQGYVTDFISVGTFAVFNVADASISVGVALLVLGVWIKDRQINKAAHSQADGNPHRLESHVQVPEPAGEDAPVE